MIRASGPSIASAHASRSALLFAASSSCALLAWQFLQWRARKRARITADRALRMVQDGPMIDCSDPSVRVGVLNAAIRRASKWMSYQSATDAQPMVGQVGGISFNKRPVLTLAPDYVLKPLHVDDRGFREVAFYEALRLASSQQLGVRSRSFSGGSSDAIVRHNSARVFTGEGNDGPYSGKKRSLSPPRINNIALENCDALAMWLAMAVQDSIVAESEHTLVRSWKAMRREIEHLRRLSNFTTSYYGVIGQETVASPCTNYPASSEISGSSHLLLSDATANFSKPCAIDIKMGTQSYEPDATPEKRERETSKYPLQSTFGFRIVGMRTYDPTHATSDSSGYRVLDKSFGRSLQTREDLVTAFRTFFKNIATDASLDQRHPLNSDHVHDVTRGTIRSRSISNLLLQLRCIRKWFEENNSLCFYSSSILMVYEGDVNVGASRDVTNLKMIDFGHVRRETGGDHGYLHGVRTLIGILSELLVEAEEERIHGLNGIRN